MSTTNGGTLWGKGFDIAAVREAMGKPPATFSPLPPHNGTGTSKAAAQAIAAHAPTQEAQVLAYVRQCGAIGATRYEAAEALGLSVQSMCGRFYALANPKRPGGPLIEADGRTRSTPSGSPARVYVARAT